MTTQEENDLWDVAVTSKSWVELVEDQDEEFALLNRSNGSVTQSPLVSSFEVVSSVLLTSNDEVTKVTESKSVSVSKTVADKMAPRNVPSIITEEESCDTYVALPTISEESNSKDSPPLKNVTQTYANILKNSPSSEVLTSTVKTDVRAEVKKELTKDFLHEDISLTGHIEGFQLTSPCKPTTGFKTPTKSTETPGIRSSPRMLKRKILQDGGIGGKVPDDVLMPSPSKIPRSADRRVTDVSPMPFGSRGPASGSGKKYSNTRKRPRDMQTPPSNRRYERPPPELETNEEVLARRQKQIDYGKNTIGYERYRQLVPKECRKSIHPRTPPMHLKYSRRAWEGLVRIWRQRLHFWDPPSEGGGDPACLDAELSDMSDVSSTDGSLPSTPVQDMKRRQVYTSPAGVRPRHHRADAAKALPASARSNNDDDVDQDCQPLSPE